MIKVGMFYFSSIYEKTGAGKVAKSFFEEKELLNINGVSNLNIYSLPFNNASSTRKIKGKSIKNLIKNILGSFYLGNCLLIRKTYFKNGERALKSFLHNSKGDEDVLLFHELYSCYAYLNYCMENKIAPLNYILVEHTNGDTWKMLRLYYPKIKGTGFEKFLNRVSGLCEEKASKIVFVSSKSAEQYISSHQENKEKVAIIPNGIQDRTCVPIKRNYEQINLVTVGTVNERKNQQMLIECLSQIGDSNINLKIVGDGPCLDKCKELAKKLGVEENVYFMGARDDVEEILDESNVFIMSSRDEGLPIAGIEALKSGLPLIMTDVGGCSELIRNNGLLVTPTKDSLINGIIWIRNNSIVKNQSMGKASYELFREKYTIESMMRSYCDLFKNCAQNMEN